MEIKNGYFEQQRTLKNSTSATEVSGIPVADRERVVQIAQMICPTVANWIKEFPVILQRRLPSVCLCISATDPDLQSTVLAELSVLTLVLFGIDDVADGVIGSHTDEQIEDLLTLYIEIVKSGGASYHSYPHLLKKFIAIDESQPWVQVANALAKCCQEIQTFPSASAYYQFFVKHFSLCMESWRVELRWRQAFERTKVYPTYEEYLANGRKSIALPTYEAALLAMVGQQPVTSEFHCPPFDSIEDHLDELMLTYAASLRLANDIRSFERERLEHKPNSLLILMLANRLTEKEAEAIVLKEIDTYLKQAELILPLLPQSLQVWGNSVKRQTWFSTEFYKLHEFHNFSKKMLADLAAST